MLISTFCRPWFFGGALLLAMPGFGQAPLLVNTSPVRLASDASPLAEVNATFSQPVVGAASLRLFGNQRRGFRAGTASGNGTSTLRLQSTQAFAPGEQLMLTVPATVQSTGGIPLSGGGKVVAFQAATGPATYSFRYGGDGAEPNGSVLHTPVLADVNNDGWLDLLIANQSLNYVSLRLGNGQGSFSVAKTQLAAGTSPNGIVLADFNNDGNLDLVTTSAIAMAGVSLRLGAGNGTFAPATPIATGYGAIGPQAGDVNGDGNLDLVYLQFSGNQGRMAAVRLGNGQGGFAAAPDKLVFSEPNRLYLADLNNDGYLDFVTGNNNASGDIYSFLGTGQGTFTDVPTSVVSWRPATQFSLADLTGDGILDLMTTNWGSGARSSCYVRLYPGTGQGDFVAPTMSLLTQDITTGLTLADVNGDHRPDLLTTTVTPDGSTPSTVYLRINEGNGNFSAAINVGVGGTYLVTGDVNRDGTIDLGYLDQMFNATTFMLNRPLSTAPVLTAFSPASGPAGTTVTLTGTNFAGATSVLVGDMPVAFTRTGAGTITFVMPAEVAHGLISVVTPAGTTSSAQRFGLVLGAQASATTLPATVFPNPAEHRAYVQLPVGTGPLVAELYSPLGQLVRRVRHMPSASGLVMLELAGLVPALYTLQLQTATQRSTQHLMVR